MGVVDDLTSGASRLRPPDWLAAYGGLSEARADEFEADDFVGWRPPPTSSAGATTASRRYSGPQLHLEAAPCWLPCGRRSGWGSCS
jgi:hypothetical protein